MAATGPGARAALCGCESPRGPTAGSNPPAKGPDLDLPAEPRTEAIVGGADEAPLLDHQGHILEGNDNQSPLMAR